VDEVQRVPELLNEVLFERPIGDAHG